MMDVLINATWLSYKILLKFNKNLCVGFIYNKYDMKQLG